MNNVTSPIDLLATVSASHETSIPTHIAASQLTGTVWGVRNQPGQNVVNSTAMHRTPDQRIAWSASGACALAHCYNAMRVVFTEERAVV